MRTALIRAILGLDELAVHVRLKLADFCLIVHADRAAIQEVFKRAVAVADHGFRQDEPSLRLAEDACVLLGRGIEQGH
ncbi:hypothetical protein D3C73_1319870 [compost metagenome]